MKYTDNIHVPNCHASVITENGFTLEYTLEELQKIQAKFRAGDEVYTTAQNIPRWVSERIARLAGIEVNSDPVKSATLATIDAMIDKRKNLVLVSDTNYRLEFQDETNDRVEKLEAIYNVLSGRAFEVFMHEDGHFGRHIEGAEGCLKIEEILVDIERLFKAVL